jgi:hypothetical protein
MRKIIQITTTPEREIYALCDDGTLWTGALGLAGVYKWEQVVAIPQDAPATAPPPVKNDEEITEKVLREMMRDPRYWKDRDPSFVQRVTDGFRKLVGMG